MPEPIDAQSIIRLLNLEPLPVEGGMFRQTYVSAEEIPPQGLPERYGGHAKPFGTAIFYLLTSQPGVFSAFHRLASDEMYHFYLGDPVELILLMPDGEARRVILGQGIAAGQQLQALVPRGVWQGSRVLPGGAFGLLGTTMAPGFSQADFEPGARAELIARYPAEREIITALTRE